LIPRLSFSKKQCEREGILSEVKKHEFYDKPSVKKKKKIIAARQKGFQKTKVLCCEVILAFLDDLIRR